MYRISNSDTQCHRQSESHVYGAKDCGNKTTPCIMSGGFDNNSTYYLKSIWCADCTKNFDRTRY